MSQMSDAVQTDPLWSHLNTQPEFEVQRAALSELRERYLPFADSNFDTELRLQVGSRFWEMYLGCAMLDRGLALVPRSQRASVGPDLCIRAGSQRIWVEAIAPRTGTGTDAVRGLFAGSGWVPEAQIVLRYRSAIEEKHKKWRKYVSSGVISEDEPFLVGVNGFQIPHGHNDFPDEIP